MKNLVGYSFQPCPANPKYLSKIFLLKFHRDSECKGVIRSICERAPNLLGPPEQYDNRLNQRPYAVIKNICHNTMKTARVQKNDRTDRGCNHWMPSLVIASAIALLGLTACNEERRAECEKIDNLTNANYQKILAAGGHGTPEGFLKEADISARTANTLVALELGDKNLSSLRSHLAASLRQKAAAARAMATVADDERTITSASERSAAHQKIVLQAVDASETYGGMLYALEVYCNSGQIPQSLAENPLE